MILILLLFILGMAEELDRKDYDPNYYFSPTMKAFLKYKGDLEQVAAGLDNEKTVEGLRVEVIKELGPTIEKLQDDEERNAYLKEYKTCSDKERFKIAYSCKLALFGSMQIKD